MRKPSENTPSPANFLPWAVISIAFPSLFLGCSQKEEPLPEAPPPAIEKVVEAPRPTITQPQYDKLLYDMIFADVVDQLGMDPTRQESTFDEGVAGYTGPSVISWYIWENSDGSFIRLGFTGKRLTDKQSEGLPDS